YCPGRGILGGLPAMVGSGEAAARHRHFFKSVRRRQLSTLFPYTTLFRSPVVSGATMNVPRCALSSSGETTTQGRVLRISPPRVGDRKSTRLNSSHVSTSYAVFCLKNTSRPASATA